MLFEKGSKRELFEEAVEQKGGEEKIEEIGCKVGGKIGGGKVFTDEVGDIFLNFREKEERENSPKNPREIFHDRTHGKILRN